MTVKIAGYTWDEHKRQRFLFKVYKSIFVVTFLRF